jgi:hypothetical protein
MTGTTNPIIDLVRKAREEAAEREAKTRELRPGYFDRIDTLLASGAFAVEDRRATHPPTGRRYAD